MKFLLVIEYDVFLKYPNTQQTVKGIKRHTIQPLLLKDPLGSHLHICKASRMWMFPVEIKF